MDLDCAICGSPRLLMKCSECGRRACGECYTTRHALCTECASAKGLRVRSGPHMF